MRNKSRRTAFDQLQLFSFDDAARALVFDDHGWMVPALPTKLTPEGVAYHTWIDVLREAVNVEPKLDVSIYQDDPEERWYIQRDHFKSWCAARGMSPRFLFGDETDASIWPFVDKEHTNYAPELAAAVSAWLAMFGNGDARPNRGTKEALSAWLAKSGMSFSEKAVERMASVITPADRKDGGAIKISSKK